MALERVEAQLAPRQQWSDSIDLRASMTTQNTASLVSIHIGRLEDLRASYMPFLKHGGLFIPFSDGQESTQNLITLLAIRDDVCLLLRLLNEREAKLCLTEVAWISPTQGQGAQTGGIGLHFSRQSGGMKSHIEAMLQGNFAIGGRAQTL